jgi:PKD repeat protein
MAPSLTIDPSAVISAVGGNGGDTLQAGSGGGGGGGGGRIAVVSNQPSGLLSTNAVAPGTGAVAGAPGTTGSIFQRPFLDVEGPSSATAGQSVSFSASPAVGQATSYSWDFGDGTAGSGASPSHAYSAAGTYAVVATATMMGSGTTVSNLTSITVNKASPTLATQASVGTHPGDLISDTATLANGSNPTGSITFNLFGPNDDTCSGSTTFTSTKTVNGNGQYTSDTFALTGPGSYHWVASYGGDTGNSSAGPTSCSDPAESVTVTKISTATQVTSAPNPSGVGQSVTFTATVSPQSGTATPTGVVQFKDGSANLGAPQTLTAGQATLSTSSLSAGNHTIEADYGGDNIFALSSGALTQTVNTPSDAPLTITHIGATANNHGDAAAGVTFTDADPQGNLSQYSGTIDWGDHSPATAAQFTKNPFGGFAAGGLHHYTTPGTFAVTITIRDVGGATATKFTTLAVPRQGTTGGS